MQKIEQITKDSGERAAAAVSESFQRILFAKYEYFHEGGQNPATSQKEYREYIDSAYRHKSYKHYGTRSKIAKIIENRTLLLSDGSNWNDKCDRDTFNNESDELKHFGICFSWAQSESVAMWMLYGGRGKDGAMIDFPRRALNLSGEFAALGRINNKGLFEKCIEVPREGFYLDMADVLYADPKMRNGGEYLTLNPGGQRKQLRFNRDAMDALPQCIIKSKAWEYEQEIRLIASVPKSILGDNERSITHLQLQMDIDAETLKERAVRSPLCEDPRDYRASSLQGQVDWDLCWGCDLKRA